MVVAQEKIEWQEPIETLPRQRKKVVRKKEKRQTPSFLLLIIIVAAAGTIAMTAINLTVAKGAEVRTLEKQIADIQSQNDLLQLQVDKLRSVSRIESAALAMGMEKPAGTVYVSGTLPSVKPEMGIPDSQTATAPKVQKPSVLKQVSELFTSFFASTQR